MSKKNSTQLWKTGAEFLHAEHSIMCGAMSWVSEHNLVSAISNAGGFGVIACGSMSPELLDKEIKLTRAKTFKSFGVNLITMHPQIEELIQTCIDNNVSHVVLAGGLPKSHSIAKLKSHNIKVLCFAPALSLAKRLIKIGADALIIEGMEAGGHIGPVSTSVLAQEILPNITEVPVFVAGGIGCGEMIASYLRMGASGCQLGTRFVCSHESIAHPNFKKAFINAASRDATSSVQIDPEFHVIPVRALANKASDEFIKAQLSTINDYRNNLISKEEAQLKIEKFWAGALKKAVIDGDIEYGSVMAGQSVGMVKSEQSVQEIINELVSHTNHSLSI
jgi:enoyl-[acyl-carrier protein] reductase II